MQIQSSSRRHCSLNYTVGSCTTAVQKSTGLRYFPVSRHECEPCELLPFVLRHQAKKTPKNNKTLGEMLKFNVKGSCDASKMPGMCMSISLLMTCITDAFVNRRALGHLQQQLFINNQLVCWLRIDAQPTALFNLLVMCLTLFVCCEPFFGMFCESSRVFSRKSISPSVCTCR